MRIRLLTVVVCLVALVGTIAAVAVAAAIPSADGTITACRKSDGSIRLIDTDSGATCKSNEQALTWNQTGPQGPPGMSGYEIVSASRTFDAGDVAAINSVSCPDSKRVLGGGFRGDNWTVNTRVTVSEPFVLGENQVFGWQVRADGHENNGAPWRIIVWATCASVNS